MASFKILHMMEEILKIIGYCILAFAVLYFVTVGIGFDDSDEPNQFDID